MAKKKLKKAILAGLTAYAASKMMGKKALGVPEGKEMITKSDPRGLSRKFVEDVPSDWKHPHLKPKKKWDWWPWKEGGSISAPTWKKHGGSIRTEHARLGKMIKAAQGTYAHEDESLGMRLGKGKGTAKERDMSYGKWGNRGKDWCKSGKMIKARHGTEVRTMGSNPFTPRGSVVGVKTKLNGTVKTRVY